MSKSTDRGITWKPAFSGIANTDIRGVAMDPGDADMLLAGGTTEEGNGNLYKSTNGGTS